MPPLDLSPVFLRSNLDLKSDFRVDFNDISNPACLQMRKTKGIIAEARQLLDSRAEADPISAVFTEALSPCCSFLSAFNFFCTCSVTGTYVLHTEFGTPSIHWYQVAAELLVSYLKVHMMKE